MMNVLSSLGITISRGNKNRHLLYGLHFLFSVLFVVSLAKLIRLIPYVLENIIRYQLSIQKWYLYTSLRFNFKRQ